MALLEYQEKPEFFDDRRGYGLTYDDVTVVTGASKYDESEIDTSTMFSTNVALKTPYVSAAMDSVTESEMAIALAKFGGIGVIHYGLSPKEQKREVRRVKFALSGVIEEPITFNENASVEYILSRCDKKRWGFRSFPIVDSLGKFVGLVTSKDFGFCQDHSQKVGDIMTPYDDNLVTAEPGLSPKKAYKKMTDIKKLTLPLLNEDGSVGGLYVFSDVERIAKGNPDNYNLDSENRLRTAAAVPTKEDQALKRIAKMIKYLDVAVLDSSTGDSKYAISTLRAIKTAFPDLDVVVGNISNPNSVKKLVKAGADGIKIGQGPGAICTTRRELGYGVPQITAIYYCAMAARELKRQVPICADGGIVFRGDVPKAIAAGADSIMSGSMFAGTDETPVEPIMLDDGSVLMMYRGMGSEGAMADSAAARARYSASSGMPVPQGVTSRVSYKGSAHKVLSETDEQFRKSLAGCGSKNIRRHQRCARFIQQTAAGQRESHPHDVMVVG
jgi:IMP dehydrogenase